MSDREIRDHPDIEHIMSYGYADGHEPDDSWSFVCPSCGEELTPDDRVYKNNDGYVVACEHCITWEFASEVDEWEIKQR